MFNFTLDVCANFHMVNIDVPASVGAPPLDTQKNFEWISKHIHYVISIDVGNNSYNLHIQHNVVFNDITYSVNSELLYFVPKDPLAVTSASDG